MALKPLTQTKGVGGTDFSKGYTKTVCWLLQKNFKRCSTGSFFRFTRPSVCRAVDGKPPPSQTAAGRRFWLHRSSSSLVSDDFANEISWKIWFAMMFGMISHVLFQRSLAISMWHKTTWQCQTRGNTISIWQTYFAKLKASKSNQRLQMFVCQFEYINCVNSPICFNSLAILLGRMKTDTSAIRNLLREKFREIDEDPRWCQVQNQSWDIPFGKQTYIYIYGKPTVWFDDFPFWIMLIPTSFRWMTRGWLEVLHLMLKWPLASPGAKLQELHPSSYADDEGARAWWKLVQHVTLQRCCNRVWSFRVGKSIFKRDTPKIYSSCHFSVFETHTMFPYIGIEQLSMLPHCFRLGVVLETAI